MILTGVWFYQFEYWGGILPAQPLVWILPVLSFEIYKQPGFWISSEWQDKPVHLINGLVKSKLCANQHKFVFTFSVEVFTSGHWSILRNLNDHRLQDLDKALPSTVLRSKASSTTNKHLGAFRSKGAVGSRVRVASISSYISSCNSFWGKQRDWKQQQRKQ